MRIFLLIGVSVLFLSAKAQSYIPGVGVNFMQPIPLPGNQLPVYDNPGNKKWYFSRYAGFSAGFGYFNGAGGSYVSVPFVLQLNHPLNNNLTAFAAISVAPTFFSLNHSFTDPSFNTYYPGGYMPNSYGFGINPRATMGLMYTNDAKTFSISGSISVERSSYPIYPVEPRSNSKNGK